MQSISGIIYLILIACLLPYVFTIIAKKTAGFRAKDNQHPREFLAKTTGLAARANAAPVSYTHLTLPTTPYV